jgi:L-threonylcarbamoyladenylate synthase
LIASSNNYFKQINKNLELIYSTKNYLCSNMNTTIGQNLLTAQLLLQEDEVVAIPTETVYGLAANALHTKAVLKIFEAKDRPQFNPLIVHIKSWELVSNYAQNIPQIAHHLAKVFCPGPLTFLLEKKAIIPDLVTAGSNLVAIRVPNHPMCLALLANLDFPLAAPSANQFGYISPTSATHVWQSLKGKIPYILDGGNTNIGLESTIIGFDEYEQVIIHRLGGISVEEIEKTIGKKANWAKKNNKDAPQTAGQLKSHYAPNTPLIIGDIVSLHQRFKEKKIGLISLSNSYPDLFFDTRMQLSPSNDLKEAAQHLFSFLRQIDQLDLDVILVEQLPEIGIGRAINDRLYRAQVQFK